MSKYDRIADYLDNQGVDRVAVRFAELERALGGPLPPSARKYQAWWANQASGPHVNALAWGRRGWKTADLDLGRERVTFIKSKRDPQPSGRDLIVPRELLSPQALGVLDAAGSNAGKKAAEKLNEAFGASRRSLIARIVQAAPRVKGDSTDIIRADRDGR